MSAELSVAETEMAREQEYLTQLYVRLAELRDVAAARRRGVVRADGSTPQAAVERDAFNSLHAARLAALDAGQRGLCFGRLDLTAGDTRYVGRVGLQHPGGPHEDPLLIDWRASAAQPFYLATAVEPAGVGRRRRIATSGQRVTGIADEVFDADAAARWNGELVGEAALLAALSTARTGRMGDVVETIQAEQDRIIRAERQGVLVVSGGPGTGKTAVALHRAAYLLYAHRAVLARRVILVVGPSATFCDYIGQVLPSLGETDVLLSSVDSLMPGIEATRAEEPAVAELKGRLVMAQVLKAAVRDRERAPVGGLVIKHEGYSLVLDERACRRLADGVRGVLHNDARVHLFRRMVDMLTHRFTELIGTDPLGGKNLLDEADRKELRKELFGSGGVRAAVNILWPLLTPQELLGELFTDPRRIVAAAPTLTGAERELLLREPGGWSAADIALLDEAAELLGELPDYEARARARAEEAERRERQEYAEGVLAIAHGSRSTDIEDEAGSDAAAEFLSGYDVMSGGELANRHDEIDDRTPAERAAADRTWVFGHVIVDEAQELTAMAWRVLMRRIPTRSMTIVGDLVQSSSPGGSTSWSDVLSPYVTADKWRVAELSVNYRAPIEVMTIAGRVLADIDPTATPPRSVRSVGELPWKALVPAEQLGERLRSAVEAELTAVGEGNLAVLVAPGAEDAAIAALAGLPGLGSAPGRGPDLRARIVVLTVGQCKGLEFDAVLVVEPAAIVAASPRGRSDLYVALTRATHRLGVLHTQPLPPYLAGPEDWAE